MTELLELLTTARAAQALHELDDRLDGDVVLPSDEGYDEARLAWHLAAVQVPAAVVFAESADDVAETVRFARAAGLRVAPQGTGHGAPPLGDLTGTILLKTERMRGVEIDPVAQRARAEAGVLWEEVVGPATEHGLTALHGSSPDVGVVGYSLGGGMGWLARSHGLATNSVTAIELVTGDGRFRRVDADEEPELFWALRGGGGNFGVVTAIEFRLYPLRELYAGVLFFPVERASEVLHAWREWVETVPEQVTSVGRMLAFPPFPEVPEPLRGRTFALVEAAYQGSEADGAALLAPLRALGPELDTFATVPAAALQTLHMDPPEPVAAVGDGMLLDELPAEAIDAVVAHERDGQRMLSVEFRHTGGALARRSPGAGALATLAGSFAFFAIDMAPTDEAVLSAERRAASLQRLLAPWAAERSYPNFVESSGTGERFFDPRTLRLLRAVRDAVDPHRVVRSNHPIG